MGGGKVEIEIVILSLATSFLFIYCLYIHLQLQMFKRDFQNLSIEIENLDRATANLKTWTFEMYKWVRGRWK